MFHKRLAALRKEKSMTQQEVADAINIARATYAQYEIGRREPDYETLKKIAHLLNCTTDYLIGRSDTPRSYEQQKDLELIIKENNLQYQGSPLTQDEKQSVLGFIKLALNTIRGKK